MQTNKSTSSLASVIEFSTCKKKNLMDVRLQVIASSNLDNAKYIDSHLPLFSILVGLPTMLVVTGLDTTTI